MTTIPSRAVLSDRPLAAPVVRVIALLDQLPYSLLALAARLFPAAVFWQSGQSKLDGWRISETAIVLFRDEYRLPLIDAVPAAHLAALGEHLLPLMLVIGLASRFAALGLIGMTLVIQIFVYPDAWPTHGTWIACLLLIAARGPGKLALDHWIDSRQR